MIDIQIIREKPDWVAKKSTEKGYPVDVQAIITLDSACKQALQEVEELRQKRNEIASSMKGGKPTEELVARGKALKDTLAEKEAKLNDLQEELYGHVVQVPNMPLDDVPIGASEDENVIVNEVGDKPSFAFEPKNHAELAEKKGWLDKERAAKVAGARFAYIKGDMARVQFALLNWMTNSLTDPLVIQQIISWAKLDDTTSSKPFEVVLPPLMIKTEPYQAMDRLEPKDDRYKIEGEELWLQGSAEHVLGSMHANETFSATDLPVRYLGYATSFRKEAGTYGKDMEGIIRMHQFDKLEMEAFTTQEDGLKEHLLFVAIQEWLLTQLKLPYRKLLKCTYDIGKPNARGVDLEVWLPAQGKYRETHTADYMTDYQARRLKTRVKTSSGSEFVYTNDATALAMGRGMVAIIENYQTAEGDIIVPEVLRPFLSGKEVL